MALSQIIEHLKKDRRGTVAIIVAVLMPLFLLIMLLSVDVPRLQNAAAVNKGSLDSAALSTAEYILRSKTSRITVDPLNWTKFQPSNAEINEYALKVYLSNIQDRQENYYFDRNRFSAEYKNGIVIVKSCLSVKNSFAFSVGAHDVSSACEQSDAQAAVDSGVQYIMAAFSLDATNSMDEDGSKKITLLESAMQTIITKYYKEGSPVYGSLSPFGTYSEVYPFDSVIDSNGKSSYTLKDKDNILDRTLPKLNTILPAFEKLPSVSGPSSKPKLYVQPLTNDPNLLGAYMRDMKAQVKDEGFSQTSGLAGIYNAWLTLSPAYRDAWEAKKSYFEDKNGYAIKRPTATELGSGAKFIIHITDGEDNNSGTFAFNKDTGANSYKEICSRIKQQGVPIYIILYGVGEKPYHRECVDGQVGKVPFLYVNVAPEELAGTLDKIFSAQYSKVLIPKLAR